MTSYTQPSPTTFRTNTLKTTSRSLIKKLASEGLIVSPVSWYPDAFVLKTGSRDDLLATAELKNGEFYIQNLSSMIPVLVLAPSPDDKVLDLCAAPGSKTTQMATLMENKGEIMANDISRNRLYKLREVLRLQEITNTTVINESGEFLWRKYSEHFDKVLVDAPCSMEGRFMLDDPDSFANWSEKNVKYLALKQTHLLRSAIAVTKVGGTIVYSTCTLSPEENEGVIDWILKKLGEAIEIEEIQIEGLDLEVGIDFWKKPFDPRVKKCGRIYPSESMEGFFIAKIKKIKSIL